ncbi:MAG: hypothetical protein HOP07_01490 [Bacteriovoracaceae bacterium]|nr:hypothetical protein [Bacteriovoracaceae bacterium]
MFISKTVVICDNEFLSILYLMNLEVYLATEVEHFTTTEAAIDFLKTVNKPTNKTDKKVNLIIALEMVNKKKSSILLEEYRSGYGIKTPLLILGSEKDMDLNPITFSISNRYNIQGIIKKAAGILAVTAKQMAEMQITPYYPVSIVPMVEVLKKAPCNIYFEEESKFKLFAKNEDALELGLLSIKEKGHKYLFVKSGERLVIVNKVSLHLIEKITSSLKDLAGSTTASTEKKVEALSDGYEFAAANLFSSDEIKTEMAEIANASAKVMGDVAKDSANLKALMATMLNNKSGYIFTHSMITSYVANHIIKNVSWGGENQTDKINFILFFHDIYLSPIYLKHPELKFEKILHNHPSLNEKEKEIVMNHAKMAAELVVSYKRCPMGADMMIKHHHGMKKGSGFANKYPEDLSPLSKVLLVAEAFVEHFIETTDRKEKVEMKAIIPKLVEEFGLPSYIKIVQTLVNLPL